VTEQTTAARRALEAIHVLRASLSSADPSRVSTLCHVAEGTIYDILNVAHVHLDDTGAGAQ
jgi:hypothetical protein